MTPSFSAMRCRISSWQGAHEVVGDGDARHTHMDTASRHTLADMTIAATSQRCSKVALVNEGVLKRGSGGQRAAHAHTRLNLCLKHAKTKLLIFGAVSLRVLGVGVASELSPWGNGNAFNPLAL